MKTNRVSAFSNNNIGGNPAGVVICDVMPEATTMLAIAKDIGYSETAFLHKYNDGWRIRYFAPELEVPFCGHATIASGYVLGEQHGPGDYILYLNDGSITISVANSVANAKQGALRVSFNSPPTHSEPAPSEYIKNILEVFDLDSNDLNPHFPIRFASAGAKHLIVVLAEHARLSNMRYKFEALKALMAEHQLITINLLYQAAPNKFHSRNPFPPGGVYEDPATGAAAAAFAGYLRDIKWADSATFEVFQGEDMGYPSRLLVEYRPEKGSSIKVSGEARHMSE